MVASLFPYWAVTKEPNGLKIRLFSVQFTLIIFCTFRASEIFHEAGRKQKESSGASLSRSFKICSSCPKGTGN